jgi:hypothetical protein
MAVERAVIFLRELLAGGPLLSNNVRERVEAAGFAWSTIRRAKDQLGVEAVRESEGGGGSGRWRWVLPKGQVALCRISQEAQAMPVETQAAQSPANLAESSTAQPLRQRVITVKRVPAGPNEISFEEWRALGSETGTDCPRIREFLQRRARVNQEEKIHG